MRLLKLTALACVSVLLILFAYANVRTVSPAERLEPVSLSTFLLGKQIPVETTQSIQQAIKSTNGVTACKVNGNLASVVYHKRDITDKTLLVKLSSFANTEVSIKVLESKGSGCPVHGLTNSFSNLLSTLDLR